MLSLEMRLTPPSNWQQNANSSNISDKPEGMNQGLGGDKQMSSEMQDNPLLKLLTVLLSALMQKGQQGNADNDQLNSSLGKPDSANSIMGDLANNLLKNMLQPAAQDGAQLSEAAKPLNREVGKLMDTNPETFGTPDSPKTATQTAPSNTSSSNPMTEKSTTTTPNSSVNSTMFPTASSDAVVIDEPIVVKAGETFDGAGKTFTASSKLGDGGQSEDQKPLFILEDGASLKNVVLGDNEADGIHTYGDAKLDNVHWTDVGEDAMTMKKGGRVEISNSSAKNADDKIFQLNDSGTLILNNVQADNFGKLVRTNGGQQGDWDIQLNDVKATNGKHALVQSDSSTVNVTANNVQTENVKGMYKLPSSASLSLN
jgi:hypothetical protein